jgi:hypothetical protein
MRPSSTNDSQVRKGWPGCSPGPSVDRDEDKVVVDGAAEVVGEVGDAEETKEPAGATKGMATGLLA